MPDGNQGPFTYKPPNPQTSTSPQAFNIPGATNPAGGVARAIAFVRGLSGKAMVLGLVVVGLQAVMPEGHRPSDLIGGFHGATESAELKAKQETAAEYERKLADAKAAPPANWQMEAEAFRQQQEVMARSLETMATAAQIADAACLGAPLVTMLMGNTRDAREIQSAMQAGCAEAARIRAEITRIQAETARAGSALMQRNRPGLSP
jgi:hypothetical protein